MHTFSPLPARKRYPEALECLLAALTAPSMVTNAIAVTLKFLVLVMFRLDLLSICLASNHSSS